LLLDLKKFEFTGIVITKWHQGKRILEDELKFGKPEYGNRTIANLAMDLKCSPSDLYACIKFAREYEYSNVVRKLKDLSWHYILNELLPNHRELSRPKIPPENFTVIYADPPWRYEFESSVSRRIENQYPTMELDEIKALPVPSAENAVLFLWSPAPKLTEAFEVITAWGFVYRTGAVWIKLRISEAQHAVFCSRQNPHHIRLESQTRQEERLT
jgi:hypothetical protein